MKQIDYRYIAAAYEQRKIEHMIANGSTEDHAVQVMAERRRRREARREQRRAE